MHAQTVLPRRTVFPLVLLIATFSVVALLSSTRAPTTHRYPVRPRTASMSSPFSSITFTSFEQEDVDLGVRYLLFAPLQHSSSAESQRLAVLVYLHGAGEAGVDLSLLVTKLGATGTPPQIVSNRSLSPGQPGFDEINDAASAQYGSHPLLNGEVPCIVIAPQSATGWPNDPEGLANAVRFVQKLQLEGAVLVKSSKSTFSLALDTSRIVVTGASQGGMAVFEFVKHAAGTHFWALCGFYVSSNLTKHFLEIVDGTRRTVKRAAVERREHPTLVIVHGANDEMVPSFYSQRIVDGIEQQAHGTELSVRTVAAGSMKEIKASETLGDVVFFSLERTSDPLDAPGAGHAAWRDAFASSSPLWKWMRR